MFVRAKKNFITLRIIEGAEYEVLKTFTRTNDGTQQKYKWYQIKRGDYVIDAPASLFKTID